MVMAVIIANILFLDAVFLPRVGRSLDDGEAHWPAARRDGNQPMGSTPYANIRCTTYRGRESMGIPASASCESRRCGECRWRARGVVEVFTLFNHANYGTYVTQESNAAYGKPAFNSNIAYQPRTLQLGFRLISARQTGSAVLR
jgi:hypothetical protein